MGGPCPEAIRATRRKADQQCRITKTRSRSAKKHRPPIRRGAQSKNPGKTGHRFARGNSFGRGRPQGSRNNATIALQSLLDEEGEQITRKAIELAKAGDSTALRLVLERLIPPVRERRLSLELPKIETPAGVLEAIGAVMDAVGAGKITPSEGQTLAGLLEAQRKNLETVELEARIAAVEQSIEKEKKQ